MQLNEIHNPGENASVSLKIILLIFAVVLVGALGYFVWDFLKTSNNSAEQTSEENSQSPDYEGPKPYVSSDYGLEFDNPTGWLTPTAENVPDGPIAYPYKAIYLKKDSSDEAYKVIAISTFDKINTPFDNTSTSEVVAARLVALREVFAKKSAAGLSQDRNKQLSLPDTNASTFAFSKPEYIENADSSLRGVFYFAAIGQDDTSYLKLISVLTDDKNTVIELSAETANASEKFVSDFQERADSARTDEGVYTDEIGKVFKEFYAYVKTISSATSSETIVNEYSSTYKDLIKSFKLI